MGKIILNLAISLDGCISDEEGGYEWITGHEDLNQNTEKQFIHSDFLKTCDTIVMGRNSYEDCDITDIEDYRNKKIIVAANTPMEPWGHVEFVSGDLVDIVSRLKQEEGRTIWIFGGAKLVYSLIQADIIDEYIIGIIPAILGKGRKLFFGEYPYLRLHLDECTVTNGITILRYTRTRE